MHKFLLKQNNFKALFLLFIFLSIILMIFNICFPHEAFAMEPPKNTHDVIKSFNPDTYTRHELDGTPIPKIDKPRINLPKSRFAIDYYGHKEYMRSDAYGYFHRPQNLDKSIQVEPTSFSKSVYDNSYNNSNKNNNNI